MQYQRLGNTGLLVSDLCLGTMLFGEGWSRSTPEREAIKQVHRFQDAGGNYIDTANAYAHGRSEEIVARALNGQRREDTLIATKVRFPDREQPGPNDQGLSRHQILTACEDSLRRLKTDYIDLYYLHNWDPLTPMEESLRAMDDLVTQGKIRYIGVSNWRAWRVAQALGVSELRGWHRFVAAQYQYSLVQRDIDYEFDELCRDQNLGLHPWGPLGGGFLSGKYSPDQAPTEGRAATSPEEWPESWNNRNRPQNWEILRAVDDIAKARGATHAQISLAWLRARPTVCSVILGARTLEQLEDNLGAAELDLTDDEITRLNEVSQPPALYPYSVVDGPAWRTENT